MRSNVFGLSRRDRPLHWSAVAFLLIARATSLSGAQSSQAATAQSASALHRVTLVDNARVIVERLTLEPGQRTDPPGKSHAGTQDEVIVQLTPGDIEINTGEKTETVHSDPGKVWWVTAPQPHSLANIGKGPFDLITVHLKEPAPVPAPPTHTEAKAVPANAPPTVNYMHRYVQLENERVIVAMETMNPGQRTDAPGRVHADPRDGILIMMTPGNIEFNTGERIEIGHQEVGKTWWMPKPPFLHSVANYGYTPSDSGGPFNFMLISLK